MNAKKIITNKETPQVDEDPNDLKQIIHKNKLQQKVMKKIMERINSKLKTN